MLRAFPAVMFAGCLLAQATPPTKPEATGYQETSRLADVEQFLAALAGLPNADRLQVGTAGTSHEGRSMPLVRVALTTAPKDPLRVLVIANIHAGEIEGKEAVQVLLREFAEGKHEELLRKAVFWFVPIYNVDGNEKVDQKNRPEQNGPDVVGQRPNAQGLDLNRDFVKAEAPETQALLRLMNEHDPHLFFDLHTTDGSWHGYHLTYAPSLSTNVDPAVAQLSRELLTAATSALGKQSPPVTTFDYGNFETRDWEGNGAPESQKDVRGWWSYDHRARYCINGFGLRNRIAILSEAYSNCDFKTRIASTHAFVLAVLTAAAARDDDIRRTCAGADHRLAVPDAPRYFGFNTAFGDPETLPVLVGDCEKQKLPDDRGTRFARKDMTTTEVMPVFRRFRSRQQIAMPFAWALASPPPAVCELLARHGIQVELLGSARTVRAERFAVAAKRKPKRPYQGHQELVLDGAWTGAAEVELPAGTLWIPAQQPLARLAATLLEANSEDSLSTWNHLEQATADFYPVLRVVSTPQ